MSTPASNPPLERRSLRVPGRRYREHRFLVQMALEFLQIWFGEEGSLPYKYSDDESDTQILIHDKGGFKLENMGMLPAIITHRKGVSWDGKAGGINKFKGMNLKTGRKSFHTLARGSVVIHSIAEDSSTADEIAGCIFEFFTSASDELAQYGFFSIEAVNIGEEEVIVASSEDRKVVVSVTLVASWQRAWATQESAPTKLAKILVNLNAQTS